MARFRRRQQPTERLLTVELNARLRPLDRVEHFEDPLGDYVASEGLPAQVDGGGTLMSSDGEPERSDVEVVVSSGDPMPVVAAIAIFLTRIGAPRGSRILDGGRVVTEIGTHEGLGLYLNGSDLPDDVYAGNDVNELVAAVGDALGAAGRMLSYWEGPTETALYLYGPSAAVMRARLDPVLPRFALAQRARLVELTPAG